MLETKHKCDRCGKQEAEFCYCQMCLADKLYKAREEGFDEGWNAACEKYIK